MGNWTETSTNPSDIDKALELIRDLQGQNERLGHEVQAQRGKYERLYSVDLLNARTLIAALEGEIDRLCEEIDCWVSRHSSCDVEPCQHIEITGSK